MRSFQLLVLSLLLPLGVLAQTPGAAPDSANCLIPMGGSGIASGPDGSVYVCNKGTGSIMVYGPDGGFLRKWGHLGDKEGDLSGPKRIYVTHDGFVVVEDHEGHAVKKFDTSGKFVSQAPIPAAFSVSGFDPSGRFYGFSFPGNLGEIDTYDPASPDPVVYAKKLVYWSEYCEADAQGDFFVLDKNLPPKKGMRLFMINAQQKQEWEISFAKQNETSDEMMMNPLCLALHLDGEGHVYVLDNQNEWTGNFLQKTLNKTRVAVARALPNRWAYRLLGNSKVTRYATYLTEYSASDGSVLQKWDLTRLSDDLNGSPTDFALLPDKKAAFIDTIGTGVEIVSLGHIADKPAIVPTATPAPPQQGTREWVYEGQLCEKLNHLTPTHRFKNERTSYPSSSFGDPTGVALDSQGRIYAICPSGGGVYVFNKAGKLLKEFKLNRGNDSWKSSIAVAGNRLLVADQQERNIKLYDLSGHFLRSWDGLFPGQIHGLAVDRQNHVFLTAGSFVRKYDLKGKLLAEFGGNGLKSSQFFEPRGIAVGNDGEVYVTDPERSAVKVFSSDGKFLDAWEDSGNGAGQLDRPLGVAVDRHNNIYLSNDKLSHNPVVQVFDPMGKFLGSFGTRGDMFHPDDGVFNVPEGIAVDALGDVYVVDSANKRLQVFRPN